MLLARLLEMRYNIFDNQVTAYADNGGYFL